MEAVTQFFVEQGILGAFIVLLVGAVVFMFQYILKQHSAAMEQNTQTVTALVESANASTQVARSIEQTNELLRTLISKGST